MNFCRFYNKTMNLLESASLYFLNEYLYGEEEPRANTKEINVFEGIFYIIITLLLIFIFGVVFGGICKTFSTIWSLTTSKCDLKEDK